MDEDPFTTREVLSLLLPAWLVRFLGPFPDEVGFVPVLIKWSCIAWIAGTLTVPLDIPLNTELMVVQGVVAIAGVLIWQELDK